LTQEQQNKENRKTIPLTNSEALTFFFFPIRFYGSSLFKAKDFNEHEFERLKTYGFDLKVKQANELTIYGRVFYIALIIIIVSLMNA
jgi:hypothetical protein